VCVLKASGKRKMVHALNALLTVRHAMTIQGFAVSASKNHSLLTQEFAIVLPTQSLSTKRQVYARYWISALTRSTTIGRITVLTAQSGVANA
jgi:hypothetical protein